MKRILGHLRRADQMFAMIKNGDKIAVGLIGGKDSLMLLHALCAYRKFKLKDFGIVAISVDCTNGKSDYSGVEKFCKDHQVTLHIEPSQIFEIIFDVRKEKSPCSLCSKLRRGVLNSAAKKLGCNKIALGHHGDDLVETFLLSMTYEGRLSTFQPVSYLDKTELTLIRPLIFATEKEIVAATKGFPVMQNSCPINHKTRREYMKELVIKLDRDIDGARRRMLDAIINTDRYNLFDKIKDERKTEN